MFKLNIKRSDIVLEVGSGDFPNIYSDILVDKYPLSNRCRNFDLKTNGKFLIAAEGEALPFSDKAFDFSISANAMTYSERPEDFMNELMRVSPRGLLILPTELNEILCDTPYHRWFINYVDGKLIFRPKRIERSFGHFFHLLYRNNILFREFWDKNISLFYIVVPWQDKIIYEVQRDNFDSLIDLRNEEETLARLPLKSNPLTLYGRLKNILPNNLKYLLRKNLILFSRFPRPKIDIDKFIVCPICKNGVTISQEHVECRNCGKLYPVKNKIPHMFIDGSIDR